jgi:hypothetical protein
MWNWISRREITSHKLWTSPIEEPLRLPTGFGEVRIAPRRCLRISGSEAEQRRHHLPRIRTHGTAFDAAKSDSRQRRMSEFDTVSHLIRIVRWRLT